MWMLGALTVAIALSAFVAFQMGVGFPNDPSEWLVMQAASMTTVAIPLLILRVGGFELVRSADRTRAASAPRGRIAARWRFVSLLIVIGLCGAQVVAWAVEREHARWIKERQAALNALSLTGTFEEGEVV
jgi:hypothetical protein